MRLIIRNPQSWIVPILITLASFNGLIKAITGIRFGPLVIDAALVILFAANLATRMVHDRLKLGILDILASVFIIIALLEIFHPNIPSFQAGLEGFRKFAFMIIGFFVGRYAVNLTAIKRLVGMLIFGSCLIALYGIKQFILPSMLDYRLIELSSASPTTYLMGGHIRAFSTLSGPFHLGIYLTCTLLLMFALWQSYKCYRTWIVLFSIPQIIALIMTVTKSNWVALLSGSLVLVLLYSKRPLRIIRWIVGLCVVVFMVGSLALRVTQSVPELQTIYVGLQALLNPFEAPTFMYRIDLWKTTVLPLIAASPWIGYGTGSAGEGLRFLFENTSSVYTVAHSLYFKVQIELGLLGSVAFYSFLLYTSARIWRVNRHLQEVFLKNISNWTLAFIMAVSVSGLTGSILDAYPVNLIFWLILGISTRLHNSEEIVSVQPKWAEAVSPLITHG